MAVRSVPHSQSAGVFAKPRASVIPAVTSLGWLIAGARCVLARHRPFTFLRRSRVQDCRQTPRCFCVRLQVSSLSARVLGLAVGVYGQHTGRREMKCPTKALKDLTK